MQHRWVEFIQDFLITIHENIRELKERRGSADPEELNHIEAKLLAYNEILSPFGQVQPNLKFLKINLVFNQQKY